MLRCMRTTVDLNDVLIRLAKRRALEQGITLRAVIEMALQAYLRQEKQKQGYRLQWRTESGRLRPGVRLDDREALFDWMEDRR